MIITEEKSNAETFTVAAGVHLEFGENRLKTLSMQVGTTSVKLNEEECDELMNVLNGKSYKVLGFENKDAYQAHSAILCSSGGKQPAEGIVYTEQTLAVF
jgi:hypothetical protein